MKINVEKLEAAGLRVEIVEGGAMIAAKDMTQKQFVPMVGDELQLITQRSALHREINAALGGENPVIPGQG